LQTLCRTALSVRRTLSVAFFCALTAAAQQPRPRITAAIDDTSRVTLPGSHSPRARAANDTGKLSSDTPLQGITLVFTRTDAQEIDLRSLIAAQQNPSSPLYHHWLTPDQFAARFGTADADLAKVQSWLQRHGFTVTGIPRSRDRIAFSGTVADVASTFGTELHNYRSDNETHFSPSTDISVPAALASSVRVVTNLSDFRPRPHVVVNASRPAPNFTSSQTGSHFLTPKDIATIYDINAAYNSGYNGTNQTIAVVGQSAVVAADITTFQTAAGVPTRTPTMVLVPNSGTSTVVTSDESESDLDLEYSTGIATGANVSFVYTGNSRNYSVFDALTYAITERIAPIISISYGDCETDLGSATFSSLSSTLAQAAAQGQTVVAASGDNGSTDCYQDTNLVATQREALAVDFPSDSQYVTGMGGTEFAAADVAIGNTTYWAATNGSDVLSSALSYVPEQVWNDDAVTGSISAGGGGVSIFESRPAWQSGVSGIPAGTFRLVPDISLNASAVNAGYLYCSSDNNATGITGSCSNGFRDATNTSLTVAGGTSFAAPIFAGMLAIINQATASTGQGIVNATLYQLAANPSTYASVFHDITVGGNQCVTSTAGVSAGTTPTVCSTAGSSAYFAGTGYDQASGLGSVDLNNLLKAWPGSGTGTPTAPTGSFTIAATGVTVTSGSTGTSTVTITPTTGYTGTIAWTLSTPSTLANICYTLPSTTISGTVPVTATLTVYTSASACAATTSGGTSLRTIGPSVSSVVTTPHAGIVRNVVILSSTKDSHPSPSGKRAAPQSEPLAFAFLGLLTFGLLGRHSRRLRPLLALACIGVLTAALTGCGSGGNTSTSTNSTTGTSATRGTYTLTLTGRDPASAVTASTTVTLVIN
jgi:subtilase family serine protease